ncbi:paraneoplastic antigen Ma3 homolog [Nerophis ophidion]|uniref:paraneoplastic antigen Ma3 homolog n=1 Tax=Nerophis ophidion TaxID=159077 RepID=UPI002ADF38F1|nr:paraneoplastic antigen Ma3 homolog [Nerophis ophidion]
MVVEHIVKSSGVSSTHHTRLRPFSGKTPCPSLEVDYDTWRSNVEFYFSDTTIPDKQVVRRIVESLLPPAVNVVKHLGPQSSPRDYLHVLDSAYGTVDDADELFAVFLTTDAEPGEKASAYLHRLQSILSKVVKRNGIPASDADRQLLKQFCRGCFNNSLITHLQLSQLQKDAPPSFSELLLLVRTEEDKQAARSRRMKQHVGFNKAKVQSNNGNVYNSDTDERDIAAAAVKHNYNEGTKKIQKQLAQLQAQLANLKASMGESSTKATSKGAKPNKSKAKEPKTEDVHRSKKKPGAWYCFNCGEDGHIAPVCPNESNPEVVEAKRQELKKKQKLWDEQSKLDF